MRNVIVVTGAGQIGQAIARRTGVGKHVLLADLRPDNTHTAAEVMANAGYEVSVATVDVSSPEAVHALVEKARSLGEVTGLIHAAGVSPSQASPEAVLKADLYGTALVLEEFGNVIAAVALVSWSRRRRAAHGPGRWVYHRQRHPHGWWSDRRLLVRGAGTEVSRQHTDRLSLFPSEWPAPGVRQPLE
jgi:NAD(P)-dependent dehydrogenase (short-subunit alcohol dehydrogenase family)